jgi:hypothetical protein
MTSTCNSLQSLMDSTGLDTVASLYKLWFWVIIAVSLVLWLLVMFLLLLPNHLKLYNIILRLFISFDFQYEEVRTELEDDDVGGTNSNRQRAISRASNSVSLKAMKRHKREHLGFTKIYHVQKSQTAIGGIITVFVLLVGIVLVTNTVVTYLDPTKQQIYPSALSIQEEEDFSQYNGTIVPLQFYALFDYDEVGPTHCQYETLGSGLQVIYSAVGYDTEVVRLTASSVSQFKSGCLVKWENYVVLNPTYQQPRRSSRRLETLNGDDLVPRKYNLTITWNKPSKMYLEEILIKSQVQYFNDASDGEKSKLQSDRLVKLLFSQRQYCISYDMQKQTTAVAFPVRILSYIFQKNWFYQSASSYLPFSQTLAFPQNKRPSGNIPESNSYQHQITLNLVDGDTFSVVFPSVLSLVLSIFSVLGGVMATIGIARFFVNKFMKWFYNYLAFRIVAVLLMFATSGLGACSFLLLRKMFDQWLILTILLSVFPLMTAIGLIVHAAYLYINEHAMEERIMKYRSVQTAALHQTISEDERKRLAETFSANSTDQPNTHNTTYM